MREVVDKKTKYYPVLYNYDYYKDRLDKIPHRRFYDMVAVVKRVDPANKFGRYNTDVTLEDLKDIGLDEDELFETAVLNSLDDDDYIFTKMGDLLNYITDGEYPSDEEPDVTNNIYCLTNMSMHYGANVLLFPGIYEEVHEKLGCNYYILPANIDQLLVIKADELPVDILNYYYLIEQANSTMMDESEMLSHSLFYYDGSLHNLSFVN